MKAKQLIQALQNDEYEILLSQDCNEVTFKFGGDDLDVEFYVVEETGEILIDKMTYVTEDNAVSPVVTTKELDKLVVGLFEDELEMVEV